MRIFLTGGSGMVGQNLQAHSYARECEVLAPSSRELDLTDQQAVLAYIQDNRPDVVIHAAGQVGGIQANMADPVGFLVNNSLMGLHVINSACQAGVRHCVNLASSCMYPRSAPNPLKEEQILTGELEPTNEGYALAKITATRLCQYINRMHDEVQYLTLIPCNLYGHHDSFDPAHSHMIPAVIRKIHEAREQGAETVEIWGDGEARREFMYAEDLADCVFEVIAQVKAGEPVPDLMNVGLGTDYSINEYYQAIAGVVGYMGRFEHDLSKPVGMRQKLIDSSRVNALGWHAKTPLDDGIAKTYQFFLEEAK
ncbi:GDP-L-fucose synthase family protein [Marinobacter zhanjiangensis]|uniref:GDP-L-fucose synthase n=1 Tax=Marinobacter zhanjiangensis TaxID=578215 RepID=A0ABQ3B3F0_9GAMM|nr:GDP-L-fucose synthase [Marinobacter zhanjiangensis]GGY76358.1 GDP-L-fucose synthase [Marinobacter zhanjiangensis]